jgi:hypothetical protein
MKNHQTNKRKGKKYLVTFIAITALNLVLGAFLIHKSSGQTNKHADQKPLIVEVTAQNDNPLRIMLIDIDNSALSVQKVNYTIQNIANKPVKGYVVWAKGKNTGKITTNFFPTKSFQPGAFYTEELFLERENIKPDESLSLAIDYVEFEDGSSWGEDVQGQSEHLIGARAGVEVAVKELRNLINNRETVALTALLEKKLVDVDVSLPKSVQSEKWQKGFTDGYKTIVGFLKNQRGQGHNELLKKLNEIENLQTEGRQKQ